MAQTRSVRVRPKFQFADIDDYQKSMATASDATSTLKGVMGNLTAAVRNVGLAMTVASGIVGGAMVGMAMNAQQVSSAFREVDTISREVTDAQAEYGALVSDLNTQFGLQANRMEVIDGLYQSVSAGVTEGAEAQREFLETAAQLAVVGRVDLATTVDVLSTVMNTYGLSTEKAQSVSESLFQTVQFGKVRMEELAPVLGRVAALGSDMDTQIDEIGAAMAVLTRTGFEARVAATGLRNIFRAMMRPSENMQQMLREIALENNLFAQSMGDSEQQVREIADEYRNATQALTKWENKQAEARATTEEASLALQEARLKITAINEDRLDQLPELTSKEVKQAETVKELEQVIDDYQFKVNKARIQEEKARQETDDFQNKLSKVRKEFKENIDAAGDLESNIGSFVLSNQDLIETLVQLRQRSKEQNESFSGLFPRTRALQAALGLVGKSGQALTEVFSQMESGTLDAEEAWKNLDEEARNNFESFEAFKSSTEEVQDSSLPQWFKEATGEQATMRNNVATLKEAVQDLGAVFSEDVTEALTGFADAITKISNFAKGMSESMRSNVSQFFMLATALGLVIGPLLLVGGQIALIAQALGPALIPFLAVSAGLFGALAAAIKTAIDGGQRAESMFATMSGTLGTIRGYLKDAYQAFRTLILPELINFGGTLFSLFQSISQSLSGVVSSSGGLTSIIFNMAAAVGNLVTMLDTWFVENEEKIVATITKLSDILINRVIPDLIAFAAGVLQVISTINPAPFIAVALGIGRIVLAVTDVLGWIGRFMQRNDQLIGSIITIVTVVTGLLAALGSLAPVFSAIGTAVGVVGAIIGATIVPGMSALGVTASILTGVLSTLTPVLSAIIPGFALLSKVASVALTGIKLLAAGVGVLAGVLGLPVWATAALIAALVATIAVVWKFRDEIWNAITGAVQAFVKLAVKGRKWLSSLASDAFTWGKNLIDAFILGIQNKYSQLVSTLKGVANTVKGYIGFGSSPEKLGEDYNPKNYGGNVSTSFAEGMLNEKGEIKDSAMGISDSVKDGMSIDMSSDEMFNFEDPGSEANKLEESGLGGSIPGMPNRRKSSMPSDDSQDITIEEGAIEVGPFHGISDEELPEKVNEEVDRSLEQIIEEMRGSGRDSMERY